MDHFRILKRAFAITFDYRMLWVFGILLALTTGGGNPNPNINWGLNDDQLRNNRGFTPPDWQFTQEVINTIIAVIISLVCLALAFALVATVVRYISETALIRLVDRHEENNEKVGMREGFRLGCSRGALRLFLVDLLVGIVVFIAIILMLAVAAAPLLLWLTDQGALEVMGTIATIGLGMLVIFFGIVAAALISLLLYFVHRAIILEGLGVMDGLRRGWQIIRRRPWDVIVMGLILFGLRLAVTLVMIPVVILLVLVALVIAGLPGVLVGLLVSQATPGGLNEWAIVAGLAVGLPIFILVMAVPLSFIGGLVETYKSSAWTLTYRELVALEGLEPLETLPETLNE